MNENMTCLNETELNDYLCGWLDDLQMLSAEQHLEQCSACEQRLTNLEGNSTALYPGLANRFSSDQCQPGGDDRLSGEQWEATLAAIRQQCPARVHDQEPVMQHRDLGQYTLIRPIGRGGMAQVYLARHKKLKREFAIKMLRVPESQLEESLQRLHREIEVVGRLRHPAIVAATDASEVRGQPYLVTEYIAGLDLSRLAQRCEADDRALESADACEMIRQAAIGMAYAHAQGIVHRDIKPSNLMLEETGQVKILDFGLVQLAGWHEPSMELTTVGQMLGTLDYMAPEQAQRPEAVDHRCDIYALGATLFRLLAGRAPHAVSRIQSPLEKLRLLSDTNPAKLGTIRPDLPQDLTDLVDRCLDRDLNQRPVSAAHLAEALEPFVTEADLPALITRAIALPDPETPSFLPFSSWNLQNSVASNSVPGQGGNWWRRGVMALAVAAALVWSALFLIDQQRGQLVIETDSSDVTVKLLQDGKKYDQLELHPGINHTRLFAGNYEIVVDGPVDQYELSQDTIELKRGDVIVLRIRKKITSDVADTGADPDFSGGSATPLNQPVFEGKPFDFWESQFRFEQSRTEKEQALAAMFQFQDPDLRQHAMESLVDGLLAESDLEKNLTAAVSVPIPALSSQQWERLTRFCEQEANQRREHELLRDLLTIAEHKAGDSLRLSILDFLAGTLRDQATVDNSETLDPGFFKEVAVFFSRSLKHQGPHQALRTDLYQRDVFSDQMLLQSPIDYLYIPELQSRVLELLEERASELSDAEFLPAFEGVVRTLITTEERLEPTSLQACARVLDEILRRDFSQRKLGNLTFSLKFQNPEHWLYSDFEAMFETGTKGSIIDFFPEREAPIAKASERLAATNDVNLKIEAALTFLLLLQRNGVDIPTKGVRAYYDRTRSKMKLFWENFWDALEQQAPNAVPQMVRVMSRDVEFEVDGTRFRNSLGGMARWSGGLDRQLHRTAWVILHESGADDIPPPAEAALSKPESNDGNGDD